MKYLIVILFTLISIILKADCSSAGLSIESMSHKVTPNGLFVINGYADSKKIILGLNKKFPIFIESSSHKVKMKVLQINKGMFRVNQAIVEPTEELKIGEEYTIRISNLTGINPQSYYDENKDKNNYISTHFTISNKSVEKLHQWKQQPYYINKSVEYYGCGPLVYSNFHLGKLTVNYMEAELVNLKTKKANTYTVSLNENKTISIGHGMCSGEFDFKSNGKYKIRFRKPKSDNKGKANNWSEWIVFNSPYKK